jgi:cell pole-organizing protein PopZ
LLNIRELTAQAKMFAGVVSEHVKGALLPIEKRVEQLEKSADNDDKIKSLIADAVADIPKPEKGESVTVDDLLPSVTELINKAVSELPKPENGKPGDSVTVEQLMPVISEMVAKATAEIELPEPQEIDTRAIAEELKLHAAELIKSIQPAPAPSVEEIAATFERRFSDLTLAWERQAKETFDKAIDRMPKPKDGRNALALEDFDISLGEDGRTVTVKMVAGETVVEKSVKIASLLDRGVFSKEAEYERGDGVSWGGCFYIAKCDKPEGVPGVGETDWRLAAKRGRDAKTVVAAPKEAGQMRINGDRV